MIQLCRRWKITDCSANEALAEAMSCMPNQAAKAEATMNGTQMKPAFCNHIDVCVPSAAAGRPGPHPAAVAGARRPLAGAAHAPATASGRGGVNQGGAPGAGATLG